MSDLSFIEYEKTIRGFVGIQFQVINGQIQLTDKAEALRQKIRNLLSTYTSQWFLDVDYGIDYNSQLGKQQIDLVVLEIKSKISQINGVLAVNKCLATYKNQLMMIDIQVQTDNQLLNIQVGQNV